MIEELTNLSPAEILFIKDQSVQVDKLARVTFFDLILRQILKIEIDPKANKIEKKNPTVIIGKAFSGYESLKHEYIFLSVFTTDNELKIKLSNLLKTAFEEIKNSEEYKWKYVYSDKRMKKYFKSNLLQKIFGLKVISENGIKVQKEIKRELRRIKTNTTKKNTNIVEILFNLKGNIVLIPEIPTEIFELIEKKKSNFRPDNSNSVWVDFGYSTLYYHNTKKDQFDLMAINDSDFMPIIESVNGFNDSSGNSGCASDGGCSACGGCGGCGGCG